MKYKTLIYLSAVLMFPLFIACAGASKATQEKSDAVKEFAKLEDKGIAYLYRPGRAVDAAVQTQIKVNGLDAGGTAPGNSERRK